MIVTGKAKRTAENNIMYLEVFLKFAKNNNISDLTSVNSSHIAKFQEFLYFKHKSRQGKILSTASQMNILLGVKTYFKFLVKTKVLATNPVQDITMPRSKKSVPSPRDIFTISEIKTMLSIPDLNHAITYQDRLIMELLYVTGAREAEANKIRLSHIDLEQRQIYIFEGKGKKSGLVAILPQTKRLLEKFILDKRAYLMKDQHHDFLFVTESGAPFYKGKILRIVKKYAKEAGVKKNITSHSFRHSCATHLHQNLAPIRGIQGILRHENLNTTALYSRQDISFLREIIDKFHPRKDITGL